MDDLIILLKKEFNKEELKLLNFKDKNPYQYLQKNNITVTEYKINNSF